MININVQGASEKKKQQRIRAFLLDTHSDLLFATETKKSQRAVSPHWTVVSTDDHNGGAAIFHNKRSQLECTGQGSAGLNSAALLTSHPASDQKILWVVTYVPCSGPTRRTSLQDLRSLIEEQVQLAPPGTQIVLTGDFNHANESNELNSICESFGLAQHPEAFLPTFFPHSGQPSCLDTFFVPCDWITEHSAHVDRILWPHSDHLATSLSYEPANTKARGQPWRLNTSLLKDERWRDMIEDIFKTHLYTLNNPATSFPQLNEAWSAIKADIKETTQTHCAYLARRNAMRHEDLLNRHEALIALPYSPDVYTEIQEIKATLRKDEEAKAEGAAIRARVHWRLEFEQCTRFFFGLERTRQQGKRISFEGLTAQQTEKLCVEEFSREFTAAPFNSAAAEELMAHGGVHKVPNALSRALSIPISSEELYEAAKESGRRKSPGEDGIPVEFWYSFWNHAGPWIYLLLTKAIEGNQTPSAWSKGLIRLIPKKKGVIPKSTGDLRPITLLDADYKICARAIGSRLAQAAKHICSPAQRAFIPERDIRRNIILTQSLLRRHQHHPGAALLVDFAKAYNRIDYSYLERVLQGSNLPPYMLRCVRQATRGFSLAIIKHDGVTDPFPRQRGVGQGCPAAAVLFAIAIEPLSRALQALLTGLKVGLPPAQAAKCSLCADDLTAYVAHRTDLNTAISILQLYCQASSSSVNWGKSELICLGDWIEHPPPLAVPLKTATEAILLGVPVAINPCRHPWRTKTEKMKHRAEAWAHWRISLKGRALLAQQVIVSCMRYHASVCPVPTADIAELDRLVAQFMWRFKKWHPTNTLVLARKWGTGGLSAPHVQSIVDAHHLRFLVQARAAPEEDWSQALMADIEQECYPYTSIANTVKYKRLLRGRTLAEDILVALKQHGDPAINTAPAAASQVFAPDDWARNDKLSLFGQVAAVAEHRNVLSAFVICQIPLSKNEWAGLSPPLDTATFRWVPCNLLHHVNIATEAGINHITGRPDQPNALATPQIGPSATVSELTHLLINRHAKKASSRLELVFPAHTDTATLWAHIKLVQHPLARSMLWRVTWAAVWLPPFTRGSTPLKSTCRCGNKSPSIQHVLLECTQLPRWTIARSLLAFVRPPACLLHLCLGPAQPPHPVPTHDIITIFAWIRWCTFWAPPPASESDTEFGHRYSARFLYTVNTEAASEVLRLARIAEYDARMLRPNSKLNQWLTAQKTISAAIALFKTQ